MTLDEVRIMMVRQFDSCKGKRGMGLRRWCELNGVNPARASDFLNHKRRPTADILEALGLEWTISRKKRR